MIKTEKPREEVCCLFNEAEKLQTLLVIDYSRRKKTTFNCDQLLFCQVINIYIKLVGVEKR